MSAGGKGTETDIQVGYWGLYLFFGRKQLTPLKIIKTVY